MVNFGTQKKIWGVYDPPLGRYSASNNAMFSPSPLKIPSSDLDNIFSIDVDSGTLYISVNGVLDVCPDFVGGGVDEKTFNLPYLPEGGFGDAQNLSACRTCGFPHADQI